jgi:uncharacterized protein (DUF697 family)
MNRGQSRGASLVEAVANVLVGLAVAFAANLLVLPLFGVAISAGQAAGVSVAFTGVSVARSFALRRFFNWLNVRCPDGGKSE